KRRDIDPSSSEQVERRLEPAAAASDDRDLNDDHRSRVEPRGSVMRRFPDDRAARPDEPDRSRHTGGIPRGLDDEGEGVISGAAAPAEKPDLRAGFRQNSSAESAELSRAEHGRSSSLADLDLIEDLARRRERLDEDGFFVMNGVGDNIQIVLRKSQILGMGTRMPANAKNRSLRAVAAQSLSAPVAPAAGEVDLADDASPEERGVARPLDQADELVSGDPGKVVVSAPQLQIGVA